MSRRVTIAIKPFALLLLFACAPENTRYFFIDRIPPSEWTAEERAMFASSKSLHGPTSVCGYTREVVRRGMASTREDKAVLTSELQRLGLTSRDIAILLNAETVYGTGMTFRGLECAAASQLGKNTSFYPGVGHQWQVPFGDGFVYLRGDGTDRGMRVYAWN